MAFNWINLVIVGIGGSIGAIIRFLISQIIDSTGFPLATLIVNLLGSFLLGFLVSMNEDNDYSDSLMLFLGVGVLGSLTTMSTFAVETLNSGSYTISTLNIIITLVGVLLGALMGKILSNSI